MSNVAFDVPLFVRVSRSRLATDPAIGLLDYMPQVTSLEFFDKDVSEVERIAVVL
jgi:hypothetical protein